MRRTLVRGLVCCSTAAGLVSLLLFSSGTGALAASGARPVVVREATSAALPQVTPIPKKAGTHGYPYDAVPRKPTVPGAPYIDLKALGYVEREFQMSGVSNIYSQAGFWGSNGVWPVSVSQSNVPYTTRLLVRYPTNPAKFNGTVVFEWLNDTTGGDQDPVWSELYNQLLAKGYAYVGVTAQTPGMNQLKQWDSVRYGALGDSNDGQSYDIFTQAAEVVKADAGNVLGTLTPRVLIATGDSQSAFRIDTYVNAIQPLTHIFNGFLAVGRAVTAAPLGSGLLATAPFPALIRTDNTTPFIQLNTQGDIEELDAGAARQPDNTDLRTWEVAGASHIDAHEAAYEVETIAKENPTLPPVSCLFGTPIEGTGTALDGLNQPDNMPLFEAEDAAFAALEAWVVHGVQPPQVSPIETIPVDFGLYDLVVTNQYGIGSGGIRLPEAQVPAETYSPINFSTTSRVTQDPATLISELEAAITALETGAITNTAAREAGLCLLSGYFNNLSATTLEGLYPTPQAYATAYTNAAVADVAAGLMTSADAAAAEANADAGYGPTQQPLVPIP